MRACVCVCVYVCVCFAAWWEVRRKHSATVRARRRRRRRRRRPMQSRCALCVAQTEFSALFFLVSCFLHVIFRRTRKTIVTSVCSRRHICPSVRMEQSHSHRTNFYVFGSYENLPIDFDFI